MDNAQFKILKYFKYDHLPEHLQVISKPFGELAVQVTNRFNNEGGDIAEVATTLRKLLEAKDAAVRAMVK